jgi:hypothetical protein
MTLNNQKKAVNVRIQQSVALLLLIISIGIIYFADILPHRTLGYTRNEISTFILIIFVLFFLFYFLRDYHYIYYSDSGNKFVLRYFSLRPMAGKKNAIEFNKSEFRKYELKKSFAGLNEKIIIYRKTPGGVAKYPPLSITALNKTERHKLIASFHKIMLANK